MRLALPPEQCALRQEECGKAEYTMSWIEPGAKPPK